MKLSPVIRRQKGFTLMEILVVVAIITVLAAIAFPVIGKIKANSNKTHALQIMKSLAGATGTYMGANNGALPNEDAEGKDDWEAAKQATADKAWYNALPRQMNSKGLGDFVKEGNEAGFYTQQSPIFLPGAAYPESKKMAKPLFAIAINTKLHRKDKDGKKDEVRLANIKSPTVTVLFLEQGLPGEPKAHNTISKNDYDGACKGSAKSFVARYTGKGVIAFVDGSAREVSGKDLLTPTGDIIWDENTVNDPSQIVWTADPSQNPNQKASGQ